MLNVLVVDDEKLIRTMIKEYFLSDKINVLEAEDGKDAFKIFEENKNIIDIIILDVMMPNMDGNECCKKIREVSNVPIIMLTAKTEFDDEITGLKYGANDYVSKPFSLEALLLRIKKFTNTENDKLKNFEVIDNEKCVKKNGRKIKLTNKEFELLNYLYINRGQVLSRDMILDRIWGIDYFGDYRTVDTHIKKIRRKTDPEGEYIKTYRGVGYRFEV
jgi:DNA-binding response OmpR family regulator